MRNTNTQRDARICRSRALCQGCISGIRIRKFFCLLRRQVMRNVLIAAHTTVSLRTISKAVVWMTWLSIHQASQVPRKMLDYCWISTKIGNQVRNLCFWLCLAGRQELQRKNWSQTRKCPIFVKYRINWLEWIAWFQRSSSQTERLGVIFAWPGTNQR